jgi:hypothetical protein
MYSPREGICRRNRKIRILPRIHSHFTMKASHISLFYFDQITTEK